MCITSTVCTPSRHEVLHRSSGLDHQVPRAEEAHLGQAARACTRHTARGNHSRHAANPEAAKTPCQDWLHEEHDGRHRQHLAARGRLDPLAAPASQRRCPSRKRNLLR